MRMGIGNIINNCGMVGCFKRAFRLPSCCQHWGQLERSSDDCRCSSWAERWIFLDAYKLPDERRICQFRRVFGPGYTLFNDIYLRF